jgi:hypothetical protein
MPFDGSHLSLLSNAEILALALSRPGRAVLLALEAVMVARIAAAQPAPVRKRGRPRKDVAAVAAPRARKPRKAKVGLPAFWFTPQEAEFFGFHPLRAARALGLEAMGFTRISAPGEHYATYQHGERTVMLGDFGGLYEGDFGPVPHDAAEITDAGRALFPAIMAQKG